MKPLVYGSVCSGIEAATVAWEPLGWIPAWFSEIEAFPSRVLKHHYPNVPNLGDMTKLFDNPIFIDHAIDLLVGGTPCQSFSIAGLRGGLGDERGNLALDYCRILVKKRPRWFVWENVPGVFTSRSDGKSDFATLLQAFQECGYSIAWRVFDSQYFGVPQRRRRVFVIGYLGDDWRPPVAVLFERESLRRDFTPRRKKGQEVAGTLDARTSAGGFPGTDGAISGHVVPVSVTGDVAHTLKSRHDSSEDGTGRGVPIVGGCWWDGGQTSQTLDAVLHKGQTMPEKNRFPAVLQPVAFAENDRGEVRLQGGDGQQTGPLTSGGGKPGQGYPAIQVQNMVRRLTPLECERLQGFPGNYTAIPGAKDSPRYKALGNSMTVNVMQWIGQRINLVESIINK